MVGVIWGANARLVRRRVEDFFGLRIVNFGVVERASLLFITVSNSVSGKVDVIVEEVIFSI